MKGEVGVPVAGGPSTAFVRERASATPTRHAEGGAAGPEGSAVATDSRGSVARSSEARSPRAPGALPIRAPLRPLQEWFAGAVMHPLSVEAGVTTGGPLGAGVDAIETVVLPSSRLSGLERIDIYHRAYRARLVECLADDYPALSYALGPPAFEALCHGYMAAHPSRSPSLNSFGRHMSTFCRTRPDPLAAFGADLAALEWAMVEVVHTAAAEALSKEALSQIPLSSWAGARFTPSDTVRLLAFDYPVNAYFQAYNTGAEPTLVNPEWASVAVFREGATIWRMDLDRAMHAILAALFGGASLEVALDRVATAGLVGEREVPLVMRWFQEWVGYGFFATVST